LDKKIFYQLCTLSFFKVFNIVLFLAQIINEALLDARTKLWTACKQGDNDLLSSVIDGLLSKIKECEEEQNKKDIAVNDTSNDTSVNTDDVTKLVNDTNEDGNTMLHLAALGGHCEQVWYVL